jgi:NADH-quinone oxidoreductase subunit A
LAEQLLPVVLLGVFVFIFGAGLLFLTSLVGPKKKIKDPRQLMPYECGVSGEESGTTQIPIKYYLTAIIFILFDIEVVFMYPWALIYSEGIKTAGIFLFSEMMVFMAILIFGLFYIWRNRGLQWE